MQYKLSDHLGGHVCKVSETQFPVLQGCVPRVPRAWEEMLLTSGVIKGLKTSDLLTLLWISNCGMSE